MKRCGMPQEDQARKVTEIRGFHMPQMTKKRLIEPLAFGLRPDHGQTGMYGPPRSRDEPA